MRIVVPQRRKMEVPKKMKKPKVTVTVTAL